jgi:septal ring factor EnvC (AmiA/AmiB activator)
MKNTPVKPDEKSGNSAAKWIAAAITLLLLLGSSGYLYYDNEKIKELNRQQKEEIEALNKQKRELSQDIESLRSSLDAQKGINADLDQKIQDIESDLKKKTDRVKYLEKNLGELERLRKEVSTLKGEKEDLLKKIMELEALVAELRKKNEDLLADNQVLRGRLGELEGTNTQLQKKVDIASILKVDNVLVLGEKKGKNGKYAKTKASKAERFFVTYEIDENKVAEKGEKTIYITVKDPSGKILENGESGVFMNADDNIQMPYTQKVAVSYNNQKQRNTVAIDLNGQPAKKGTYTFQFYSDGFLSGVKKITLK